MRRSVKDVEKRYRKELRKFGSFVSIQQRSTSPEVRMIKNKLTAFSRYEYQVWLDVGPQHFQVGIPLDTKSEAKWLKTMLCIALSEVKPCRLK